MMFLEVEAVVRQTEGFDPNYRCGREIWEWRSRWGRRGSSSGGGTSGGSTRCSPTTCVAPLRASVSPSSPSASTSPARPPTTTSTALIATPPPTTDGSMV